MPARTRKAIGWRASQLGITRKQLRGPNPFSVHGDVTVILLRERDADKWIECMISTCRLDEVLAFGRWNVDRKRGGQVYARCKSTYLHRFLLKCPNEMDGDHIDGNTLNNTDKNLRSVPHKGNCQNLSIHSQIAKSGYRGVGFHRISGLWTATVKTNGKSVVKYFKTKDEAILAVSMMRAKLHPYFARGPSP